MYCSTRSPCLQRLDADKGKWVTYQLRLRKITHAEIARRAGCTRAAVTNVLAGRASSIKVYVALCAILGLSAISELLTSVKRSAV